MVKKTTGEGPTFEAYLEVRLELLMEMIRSQGVAHTTAFAVAEKAVAAALAAADRAVTKSELANDKRFESVNEFRQLVDDLVKTLMPRSESLALHAATAEKLGDLKAIVDGMRSERRGVAGGWGYAVGVVGFVAAVGSLVVMGIKFLQP